MQRAEDFRQPLQIVIVRRGHDLRRHRAADCGAPGGWALPSGGSPGFGWAGACGLGGYG